MASGRFVIVLSGFPRRSETFALHEVQALAAQGAAAAVFATKPGDGLRLHPAAEDLASRVQVLPPGTPAAQARALVQRLDGERVDAVHGYFAHAPAEVAMLAAEQLGVPFGFSAHARDVRKVPRRSLAERAAAARCVVACNHDVAATLEHHDATVDLVPHGVDLGRFSPGPRVAHHTGSMRLLAVGRLVEKKGFPVLLHAASRLVGTLDYRLRIIGDGPEHGRLTRLIARLGLEDNVQLEGSLTHRELPDAYRWADAVVVPSIIDRHGDRDGLPNVILEALATARPVVASRVAAVGAVIREDDTGLLVPPGDANALADAILALSADGSLRRRLGDAGRGLVEQRHSLGACTEQLRVLLESRYALEAVRR
ncbi:MAG: glycosyltransferase [Acidimicrobiia bacterium]